MSTLLIESETVPFTVRIVQKGDAYGANLCLQYDQEEPVVEFYDARHKDRFTCYGQFISRYYVSTLLKPRSEDDCGLDLYGGVRAWQIDSEGMRLVRRWLVDEMRRND